MLISKNALNLHFNLFSCFYSFLLLKFVQIFVNKYSYKEPNWHIWHSSHNRSMIWEAEIDLGTSTIDTKKLDESLPTYTEKKREAKIFTGSLQSMFAIRADEIWHCYSAGGSQYLKKTINDNYISNLGRCTIVTNDLFPHWLSPAELGHLTDINISINYIYKPYTILTWDVLFRVWLPQRSSLVGDRDSSVILLSAFQ